MRLTRRWPVAVALVVAVVLLFAAWVGWRAWQIDDQLSAAIRDASELQSAVMNDDASAESAALRDLQKHSKAAADASDGPTWAVLTKLPIVGDDAQGVQTASEVIAGLSRDGLEPLLATAKDLHQILPHDARISVSALRRLQRPVTDGDRALAEADRQLSAHDPSSFMQRLRDKYRELAGRVSDAHDALRAADTALSVMPGMLGEQGPRHYLLVFQNNAEIRATGGLPGAVSVVTASHGTVRMTRQVAANSFGERGTPVLPLTPAERQIYGDQLGTYFLDANFTPDFPRAAALMRARWTEVYGDHIDGVLAVDPVALSYILGATGPVKVGDVTLTSSNAVKTLLNDVYLRYRSPAAQDAFFRRVARGVFDAVSNGAESPTDLMKALGRAAREHRVYVRSFHTQEEDELGSSTVAGELTRDAESAEPQVGVYLNDGTGSKMSYYLRYAAAVESNYCLGGVQRLSGTMRISSTAPKDAASLPAYVTGGGSFGTKPGDQLLFVGLYGPARGTISEVEVDGKPLANLSVVLDGSRPVVSAPIELKPGQVSDVTWQMTTGTGQTGATALTVTPGVQPEDESSIAPTSCQ